MQYRNGILSGAGAVINVSLGFVPDVFRLRNYTKTVAGSGVGYSEWIKGVVPSANALITTYTAGAPVVTLASSNGFTPIILGGDWQNTQYTITAATKANPCAITVTSVTPTNSMTLVNGMTITISGVVGMTQLNQQRFIVAGISGTTFNLYDLFGNPVDSTAFGTWVSGGIVNMFSYPPVAPVLNPVTGQVITPATPAGLQLDIGFEGIQIGSAVYGSASDVLYYEAFLNTPTGF